MERGQFVSIGSYALKPRSDSKQGAASFILAEVVREPWASKHVDDPQPPILLYGCDPKLVLPELEENVRRARQRNGWRAKTSAVSLVTGVASWPEPRETEDRAKVARWERRVVDWVQKRWGQAVQYIVKHVDEAHTHLHWACIAPIVDRVLRADLLHPGIAAQETARGEGAGKKAQGTAYRSAMRDLQDDFYRDVGAPSGLARTTVRRVRLSTVERKAKLHSQALLEQAHRALDNVPQIDLARQAAASRLEALDSDKKRARAEAEALSLRGRLAAAERRVAELSALVGPEPVHGSQHGRGRFRGDDTGFRVL